ncbi:conjugal transfer protein [Bacillus clarus]|uniref:Conjugal transfer protein n=1 Tax=Bacillus clarus TaxID=2338372 RepID=A0A090Z0J1_9BACI|nr:cysteine-rich VLP family protein [Bacillus clarus]RFT61737.1 conjugal transfer protein [Bacillus clarus]
MKAETKVKRLIRNTCACYTPKEGNCIYQAKCPFLHSMYYRDREVKFESKRCDYFETHVLPADKELYALYFNEGQGGKVCEVCSGHFVAKGNRAKYCDACRNEVRKRQSRERTRKHRQKIG